MLDIKYATLCLLITYHWHGSWAVSTWPSGWPGIAAEVNGSPTDAPLNIPVVKRSSNQAELANEPLLPWRPVVVAEDSREELGEFLAASFFEPTHEEYANRRLKKYTEPMIRTVESKKMMIGSASNAKKSVKMNVEEKGENRKEKREARPRGKSESKVGTKSLISDKDVVAMRRIIGRTKPSTLIASRLFPDTRSVDYEGAASASRISQRRKTSSDGSRTGNLRRTDVADITGVEEKLGNSEGTNGTKIDDSAIDGTGVFDIRHIRKEDSGVLSRRMREASLVKIRRVDSAELKSAKWRANDETKTVDYETIGLPNGSSSLSASQSSQHANKYADKNQPTATASSVTSSLDVTKLLDSSRLHQQSRNTKPRRTIVKYLRRNVNGKNSTYEKSPVSSGSKKYNKNVIRHDERHYSGKTKKMDQRNRRQSAFRQKPNPSNANPNQLRFVPLYNHYGNNPKTSRPQKSSDNELRQVITLADTGELTIRNIANLPNFNEQQIENFGQSLRGVFDKHLSAQPKEKLPNVRAILPKQVFVAPPKVIYDTKIFPAPMSYDEYFQNTGNFVKQNNNNNNNRNNNNDNNNEGINNSGLPTIQAPKGKQMMDNFQDTLGEISGDAVTEHSKESVTSVENFVTPLSPGTEQVSFGTNQPEIPLVTTFPGVIYKVKSSEEMENSSKGREYETFQSDKDEPRINHESGSETGAKNHLGNVGSSYGNSESTYPNKNRSGSGNVNHSTVIESINDEYANHQNTGYGHVSKMGSDGRMRMSQMKDGNYQRGKNRWREEYSNDHIRYDAKYTFGYIVNDDDTRNDFGHHEMRDKGITTGRYHVRLPDGRTQKVNYRVDDGGYHAVITYERNDD